jgi:hypothetical protein
MRIDQEEYTLGWQKTMTESMQEIVVRLPQFDYSYDGPL